MKKLLFALCLALSSAACLTPLPEVTTLPEVELPVAAEQAQVWNSTSAKNKPILMVFMGSWCPWCKKTMPAVMEVAEVYGNKVEIVAVFADANADAVKNVIKEHGFTVKSLYDGGELIQGLGVNGFPHSVLFDKKHRAVKHWEGYSPNRAQDYLEALKQVAK